MSSIRKWRSLRLFLLHKIYLRLRSQTCPSTLQISVMKFHDSRNLAQRTKLRNENEKGFQRKLDKVRPGQQMFMECELNTVTGKLEPLKTSSRPFQLISKRRASKRSIIV